MHRAAEHYHAEMRFPDHPEDDEDRSYRDVGSALGRAEEKAAALRANGYVVERTDTGNDDAGVIREYHIADGDGTPLAMIEVRSCQDPVTSEVPGPAGSH